MFKKLNTKILIIAFVVLLAIVVIFQVMDSMHGDRSFKSDLFKVDTAQITSISVFPKNKKEGEIKLIKTGKSWKVENNGKSYAADAELIQSLILDIVQIKAERVAATSKSNWREFELTDSAATKIKVEEKGKISAEFWLGKFSFQQTGYNPYMQQNVQISVHIRVPDDEKVYVIKGFMSMMMNQDLSAFRNKNIVREDKNNWSRLTFSFPGDSSFVLNKQNNKWEIKGMTIDSVAVTDYLSSLENLRGSEFVDDLVQPPLPKYILKIEGNSKWLPIEIKAAPIDSVRKYMITSTINEGSNFSSAGGGLFERIFVGNKKFLPKKEVKIKK